MSTLNAKVILNVKTAAEWANSMEILLEGELGIESDTRLIKIGNGVDTYISLPYTAASDINDIEGVTVTNPTDGNVLTYSNGEWVNITPSSLPVDTDLSHYDNTTSGFITSADIPALPADTDLSHYNNTNSDFATVSQIPTDVSQLNNDAGYITSADLPTVGDGTITIQANSINVDSFTTNQNTNKTINITIPTNVSELNNDAGYVTSATLPTVNDGTLIIRQDGNTIATFTANSATNVVANITSPSLSGYLPLSGGTMTGSIRISGSGFTLGDSTQGWSTVYTGQTLSNSNTLRVGGNDSSIFYFAPTATATTNSLGSSTSSWSSGYIDSVYATNIKLTGALTVGIPSDVSAYKRITIKGYDGNTESTLTDWAWLGYVSTGVFGFRPITSDTGTLGTTSEFWNKGYFTNLCTTGIYSKYDPNTQLSSVGLYYNTHVIEVTPAVQWGYMGQKSANEIGIFPLVSNTYLGSSSNYWDYAYVTNIHFSEYNRIADDPNSTGLYIGWRDSNNSGRYIRFAETVVLPVSGGIDLGESGNKWKDGYFSGDVYCNSIKLTNSTYVSTSSNNRNVRIETINSSSTQRSVVLNPDYPGFFPEQPNILNLGHPSYAWNVVYAQNGTIQPSDINKKANIVELEDALKTLNSLSVYSYTWRENVENIVYGFIAQEALEKAPELVNVPKEYEENNGTLGMYTNNVLFLAVKAIQELSSKVDELNAKIKLLEGRV